MKYLVLILKGVAYGITHVVPGLGGGLVLILMGIYEQFVDSVGNFFIRRDRWREYLAFLIPVGIGMVLGLVVLSKVISVLLDRFPVPTMFFFMGLLLGTIPSVLKLHGDMRPSVGRIVAALAGLGLVILVKVINPATESAVTVESMARSAGFLYNLGVCFVAGGASVTPGLDGSYVLLLGGTYDPIIKAVSELTELVIQWGALVSTALGAGLGILAFSKLIDTAIKRAPSISYYVVLGLIVGSVYGLWPQNPLQSNILVSLVAFALGFVAALYFSRQPAAQ